VGTALFLMLLAEADTTVSALKASYPQYHMGKKKIQLTPDLNVDVLLKEIALKYQQEELNTVDGVKIDFADNWVHMRKSNTEPIVRIYTEAASQEAADALADRFIGELDALAKGIV
jgi:phosphomannomutase